MHEETETFQIIDGIPHKYAIPESAEQDIARRFTYHSPRDDQPDRYVEIRNRARALARDIVAMTPPAHEQYVALNKLEEAVFWANAAIARNE